MMTAANEALDICDASAIATDWRIILTVRPNVLLQGTKLLIDAWVAALRVRYGGRIVRLQRTHVRSVSQIVGGLVVLEDAASYGPFEQAVLISWLENQRRSVQVITTTERPLLDLVQAGMFSERLFYRLNTLYVDLGHLVTRGEMAVESLPTAMTAQVCATVPSDRTC